MHIRSTIYGRVKALCGFTATGHGASDLRMPWSVAQNKLRPGVEEVPD